MGEDKGRRIIHYPPLLYYPLLSSNILYPPKKITKKIYCDCCPPKFFLNYVLRYSKENVYLCGKLMVNYESIQIHFCARWTA